MASDGYTPFTRTLDEIQSSDLTVLKTVPEGWYVEYKEMFPDQASVAKSISAFANTYGGWLFYGIRESSDGERKAGGFPGIDVQNVATNDQQIRQAATAEINPIPYFVTRVLQGPEPSIGLAPEKAIIVATFRRVLTLPISTIAVECIRGLLMHLSRSS
jgi:Schlafen, AlbA_2